MAEAIGFAASIIQIAGAGLKLSQILYEYAGSVTSADRRIKDIAKEIQLTAFVIEELGNLFSQSTTSTLLSKNALKTADETVRECFTVFKEIQASLKINKKSTLHKFMLPFRETKIELLRSHVDKLKSTLQLLMQVLTHAHQVASQKLDREAEVAQREEIKALLQMKNNSTKRYEESLRKYSMSLDDTVANHDDEDGNRSISNSVSSSSTAVMNTAAVRSSITVQSLETCVSHIRTLLGNLETLQHALGEPQEGKDNSKCHQSVVGSYLEAREHLDSVLLGNASHAKNGSEIATSQNAEQTAEIDSAPCFTHITERVDLQASDSVESADMPLLEAADEFVGFEQNKADSDSRKLNENMKFARNNPEARDWRARRREGMEKPRHREDDPRPLREEVPAKPSDSRTEIEYLRKSLEEEINIEVSNNLKKEDSELDAKRKMMEEEMRQKIEENLKRDAMQEKIKSSDRKEVTPHSIRGEDRRRSKTKEDSSSPKDAMKDQVPIPVKMPIPRPVTKPLYAYSGENSIMFQPQFYGGHHPQFFSPGQRVDESLGGGLKSVSKNLRGRSPIGSRIVEWNKEEELEYEVNELLREWTTLEPV